ncbi:Fe-S cluster assembly protein NifU [Candidatus Sumerlaeota bacterium]|nr:Fe-S cluster assembly protein NifU [Candidatus Sumerlaeota bacterium]
MWEYSPKVIEHFMNPRNVGEIEDPDAEAQVGSFVCGDMIKLQLKINDQGIITDAKFKTFGCGAAIASASVLTEMIIGKSVDEVAGISNEDIIRELGGLPEAKIHCSVMGADALRSALEDYYAKQGLQPPPEMDTSPLVCHCFGVTQNKIRNAIFAYHLRTVDEVTTYTKAGGGCGKCKEEIQKIINATLGEQVAEPPELVAVQKRPLTNLQRMKMIEDVIEKEIRPQLQADGGDIKLVDIKDNIVQVEMLGTCRECPVSPVTIKQYVEQKLRELVDNEILVEEVK